MSTSAQIAKQNLNFAIALSKGQITQAQYDQAMGYQSQQANVLPKPTYTPSQTQTPSTPVTAPLPPNPSTHSPVIQDQQTTWIQQGSTVTPITQPNPENPSAPPTIIGYQVTPPPFTPQTKYTDLTRAGIEADQDKSIGGVIKSVGIGAGGAVANQFVGLSNFLGKVASPIVKTYEHDIPYQPTGDVQRYAGYGMQVGEVAAVAVVAPHLLPVTIKGVLGAAALNVGISQGMRFLPSNPVTGDYQGKFGTPTEMLNEALIGEAFAVGGAGALKGIGRVAETQMNVVGRTAAHVAWTAPGRVTLFTGAGAGMGALSEPENPLAGAAKGAAFGFVFSAGGEIISRGAPKLQEKASVIKEKMSDVAQRIPNPAKNYVENKITTLETARSQTELDLYSHEINVNGKPTDLADIAGEHVTLQPSRAQAFMTKTFHVAPRPLAKGTVDFPDVLRSEFGNADLTTAEAARISVSTRRPATVEVFDVKTGKVVTENYHAAPDIISPMDAKSFKPSNTYGAPSSKQPLAPHEFQDILKIKNTPKVEDIPKAQFMENLRGFDLKPKVIGKTFEGQDILQLPKEMEGFSSINQYKEYLIAQERTGTKINPKNYDALTQPYTNEKTSFDFTGKTAKQIAEERMVARATSPPSKATAEKYFNEKLSFNKSGAEGIVTTEEFEIGNKALNGKQKPAIMPTPKHMLFESEVFEFANQPKSGMNVESKGLGETLKPRAGVRNPFANTPSTSSPMKNVFVQSPQLTNKDRAPIENRNPKSLTVNINKNVSEPILRNETPNKIYEPITKTKQATRTQQTNPFTTHAGRSYYPQPQRDSEDEQQFYTEPGQVHRLTQESQPLKTAYWERPQASQVTPTVLWQRQTIPSNPIQHNYLNLSSHPIAQNREPTSNTKTSPLLDVALKPAPFIPVVQEQPAMQRFGHVPIYVTKEKPPVPPEVNTRNTSGLNLPLAFPGAKSMEFGGNAGSYPNFTGLRSVKRQYDILTAEEFLGY